MNISITIAGAQSHSSGWMTWCYISAESSPREAFLTGLIIFVFVGIIFAIDDYINKRN